MRQQPTNKIKSPFPKTARVPRQSGRPSFHAHAAPLPVGKERTRDAQLQPPQFGQAPQASQARIAPGSFSSSGRRSSGVRGPGASGSRPCAAAGPPERPSSPRTSERRLRGGSPRRSSPRHSRCVERRCTKFTRSPQRRIIPGRSFFAETPNDPVQRQSPFEALGTASTSFRKSSSVERMRGSPRIENGGSSGVDRQHRTHLVGHRRHLRRKAIRFSRSTSAVTPL